MLHHLQTFKSFNAYLDEGVPAFINIVNQPLANDESRFFMEETIRLFTHESARLRLPMGIVCDLRRVGDFDSYIIHILHEQLPVFAQYAGAPSIAYIMTEQQAEAFNADSKPQAMNRELKCPVHLFDNIDDARSFYRRIFDRVRSAIAA